MIMENDEFSLTAITQKRSTHGAAGRSSTSAAQLIVQPPDTLSTEVAPTPAEPAKSGFVLPFDPFRALDVLYRHGIWCLAIGLPLGIALFILGKLRIDPSYTALVQVVRQEAPNVFRASEGGESFRPAQVPMAIMMSLMRSNALLERVSTAMSPALSKERILSGLTVTNDRNSDLLRVTWNSGASARQAAEVANTYAKELIAFSKEVQSRDAAEINRYLKQEIARVEQQIMATNDDLLRFSKEAELVDADKEMTSHLSDLGSFNMKFENLRLDFETLDLKIASVESEFAKASPLAGRLRATQQELATLQLRYTEENPKVAEAHQRVQALEEQMKSDTGPRKDSPPAAGENPIAESLYLHLVELRSQKEVLAEQLKRTDEVRQTVRKQLEQLPRKAMEYALIKDRRSALESARSVLSSRQREADLYEQNALGFCRLLAPAREEDVFTDTRFKKIGLISAAGFFLGLFATAAWFLYRSMSDGKVHSPADLKRATHLPVLATLPESLQFDLHGQQMWAFRTWVRLQPQLATPHGSTVCGLLSEDHEGQSPLRFASLFAEAAAWRGSPVMIISHHPVADKPAMPLEEALLSVNDADRWLGSERGIINLLYSEDWTWTVNHRMQLEDALHQWQRNRGAVIFVELPHAARPEAVLMAERLPQLLWVGTSRQSTVSTIARQLQLYRHAGCRLIGSLLDGGQLLQPPALNRFTGVLASLVLLAAPLLTQAAESTTTERLMPRSHPAREMSVGAKSPSELQTTDVAPPAPTSPSLQVSNSPPPVLLGPGDGVNITIFGQPETRRTELGIGPDGRLSYLQAQDIQAAGLTLDQLRERLNQELSRYYQSPHVILTPAGFQSRKIYILGKVLNQGVLNYDRPFTILEAITQAGGLETGHFQQNTVELADLGRTFLMRDGHRVPVDFEALFNRGDMSHNVLLQPNDYLYFPSANSNEIYVLGNVAAQGAQGLLAQTTVTSAITLAGGFTRKAYTSRVLVIRGSLDKPQTFAVDMAGVLSGRARGFKLEPKDIVFVSDKPWARVEQIVDLALSAFIQGAIGTYTNSQITPVITKPLFGQ